MVLTARHARGEGVGLGWTAATTARERHVLQEAYGRPKESMSGRGHTRSVDGAGLFVEDHAIKLHHLRKAAVES